LSTGIAATVDGVGDAVLLLHGQPGTRADWKGVRRALRDRFRVVVPDRPGYGETGGRALGMRENADAMVGFLDELEIQRATVAGHSWGAGVALAMAQRHPERLTALVLVCPVTPSDRLGPIDRALADRRLGPPLARTALYGAGAALGTALLQRRIRRLLPGFEVERVGEVAREWRWGDTWRSFYREQRALFDELPQLRREQGDVAAPLTVVIGGRDRVTDPAAGRELAARAGGNLVEVETAGHLLPMQAPRQVADAIASAA
jgi:non-heme chloroperoxidase